MATASSSWRFDIASCPLIVGRNPEMVFCSSILTFSFSFSRSTISCCLLICSSIGRFLSASSCMSFSFLIARPIPAKPASTAVIGFANNLNLLARPSIFIPSNKTFKLLKTSTSLPTKRIVVPRIASFFNSSENSFTLSIMSVKPCFNLSMPSTINFLIVSLLFTITKVRPLRIFINRSTPNFISSPNVSNIATCNSLKLSLRVDSKPPSVLDCFSIAPANKPDSVVRSWKACWKSRRLILLSDTSFLIDDSATPRFFASTGATLIPRSCNWSSLSPVSLPAAAT